MIIPVILFIVGLLLLIKGGDWFVEGAVNISHRFRIPEVLIGATVVSIGTTLPEVMVSAASAFSDHGEMAYGNAIGSIICNTALIAAITVAVRPSKVDPKSLRLPIIFFFSAAAFYAFTAYVFGYFSRLTGILLLLIFAVYMAISVKQALKTPVLEAILDDDDDDDDEYEYDDEDDDDDDDDKKEAKKKKNSIIKDIVFLVLGAALIAVGADLLVDNGTIIAEKVGVPESVIALTFVALGKSLPELVTAVTSLVKGHGSLSLGNIIGANLFNLVLVSGVST
ncbi:MAG: calcium/sodium antiporter, partial [Clostridia bacterium]|nr:calcium/sodium antiporter [Clostridia bacterium]